MAKVRIILLYIIIQNFVSTAAFGQIKSISLKKISEITKNAIEYRKNANFEKSLVFSRLALKQSFLVKNNDLISQNYSTIASNYNELCEFDKAIFYYKKSLIFAEKTSDDILKCHVNNNLGNMYCFEKKQYIKGIDYYKKSLVFSEKIKDTSEILFTKLNITWAYFDINRFSAGAPYLFFVNKNYEDYGNESISVVLKMLNAMYYSYRGEDSKANTTFLEAIETANDNLEKSDLSFVHQEYSKFLLKKREYKAAYLHLALYNTIQDELYAQEKLEKASIQGVNFELDEYRRAIQKKAIEINNQFQSLKKSRIIVSLFIIVFVFLLLLLISFNGNIKLRKKTNAELLIANQELLIANEKAREASLLKTQFISTISHELRTPLYGVVGITDMLLDEHKELAFSPHLKSLKFSARYLLSLVNDILQINKIEEKKIVLEKLTFNILDEIIMIKNSLSFLAYNNNNSVNIQVDPSIPEYVIGDKLRLSQILINLVCNALKFTNDGIVKIGVSLVKTEGDLCFIEFKIEDNGIGIDPGVHELIFDKFVQVSRNEDDYQGTGLGLSIVKRLLELFNSTISLQSKVGEGTIFSFTLALESDVSKTNELINNIQVDLSSSQIFNVLIVEDNRINQLVTKKTIEKNNYKCTVVDDGFAALEILEKEAFDIILMDINMPVMSGFETTRRIRSKGINTPIVALTAFDKDEISEESIDSGINDIIIKPFDSTNLFKVINCLLLKTKNVG
jgi:signal transduction histidine kinase/CheY-like chemotaxis protein